MYFWNKRKTIVNMAAFVRTILKKPHVKPLLLNCTTFGMLYGAGELTQQSKAIYYDVSLKKTHSIF